MYKSSNFISNSSFQELYGHRAEESSSGSAKKRIDESSFGVVKVSTSIDNKREKEFVDLRIVQDFAAHKEAILVAEFDPTWEYLATGWKEGILKIWKILGVDYDDEPYSLFRSEPYRIYQYEENNSEDWWILSLSWW